ncbi:hypothetical protein C8F01DRAFT_404457 [Mycena amicta]|nr:hypothetical protein C8F01DRAFT_199932 [Mycena amicta]KAJ7070933.1 hypothetical protein C8F01DRAFT_404457 [Mycena amicta]
MQTTAAVLVTAKQRARRVFGPSSLSTVPTATGARAATEVEAPSSFHRLHANAYRDLHVHDRLLSKFHSNRCRHAGAVFPFIIRVVPDDRIRVDISNGLGSSEYEDIPSETGTPRPITSVLPSEGDEEKQNLHRVPSLSNFHDMIVSTLIICSYTISPQDGDIYLDHYISDLESSLKLFPGLTVRPNHHYAIHKADQMRWWGPLTESKCFG